MLLQPGDGAGQSVIFEHECEQCGPYALNGKQRFVSQSTSFEQGARKPSFASGPPASASASVPASTRMPEPRGIVPLQSHAPYLEPSSRHV